ncbi:MAG: hypothetical protein FWD90_07135 [Defluviitaleaceae bacterium]|nr:hypothetical protein [Defluviitaleaceae bacterium]
MKNLKKKVALLLAFVMMLSLVPMNVFGAPAVNITATTVASGAQVVEPADGINLAAGVTGVVRFEVPLSSFIGVTNQAAWNAMSLTATLGSRGGNSDTTGTLASGINIYIDGLVNNLGQAVSIPGGDSLPVVANSSSLRANAPATAMIPMTTGAGVTLNGTTLASLAITPGGVNVQFRVEVTNVRNGDATIAIGINGLPGSGLNTPLLGATRLVTRIAPVTGLDKDARNFTVGAVSNPPRLQNREHPQGGQAVANITINERTVRTTGELTPAAFRVTLEAPRGYVWHQNPSVVLGSASDMNGWAGLNTGSWSGVGTDTIAATITIGSRAAGPLAIRPGFVRIEGLQLRPLETHTLRAENLRATIKIATTAGANLLHDVTEVDRIVAVQEIRRTEITAGTPLVIQSGVLSNDIDWDEDDMAKTAVITITEGGRNSLADAPVMVQMLTPGVTIRDVRLRFTQGDDNEYEDNDDKGWNRIPGADITNNMAIVRNPVGSSNNRGMARTAQIQMILQVPPGFGGTDVEALVTVMTHEDAQTERLPIATIVDPIELDVDEVREIPIRDNAEFTFLPARRLGSVTVTPRNADVFDVDDTFYVFLRAVDAEGNAFTLPQLGITWTVEAVANGALFEINEGQLLVPTASTTLGSVAQLNAMLPHRIAGWLFEVNRIGTAVPSITFHSTLTGTMINEPGIQFEFVVLGSAVQEHNASNIGTTVVPLSQRIPYRAVVGQLVGELVLGNEEETAPPPPPTPTPAPTPEPVVNEPARLTIDTTSVNSAGQPNFIVYGGNTLVNLRGLFMDVIPDGSLTRANSVSTFSAPQANNGPMVQIMVPDPRFNEDPFIRIDGQVVSAVVARGFALQLVDDTWYVPMSAFTDLLGYLIN